MNNGLKRTCKRTLITTRQSPLFNRLTVNQTEKIAPIVNSSDGVIRARELHDALSGIAWKINCLESIFCNLVVGTPIDQERMNLPDFFIFLCQRREHLSIRDPCNWLHGDHPRKERSLARLRSPRYF